MMEESIAAQAGSSTTDENVEQEMGAQQTAESWNQDHPPSMMVPPATPQPPYYYTQQQQQLQPASSSSFGTSSMWMGAGAVLGLTAAATVRWLNGGDFLMFPPPNTEQQQQQQQQVLVSSPEEEEHEIQTSIHPPQVPSSEQQNEFRNELRSLVDAIHQQNKTQTNLVQQLVRREDVQLVNDSMQLLRRQQSSSQENTTAVTTGSSTSIPPLELIQDRLAKLENQLTDLQKRHASISEAERQESLDQMLQTVQVCRKDASSSSSTTKTNTTSGSNHHLHPQPTSTPVIKRNSPSGALVTNSLNGKDTDTTTRVSTDDTTGLAALGSALQILTNHNDTQQLQQGVPLLYLYVHNLHQHSQMPRYRRIFTSNESFGTKVQPLVGGKDILRAVGFVEQEGYWEWLPTTTSDKKKPNSDNDNDIESTTQAALEKEHSEYLREAAHALQELKKQVQGSPANFSPLRPPHHEPLPVVPQTPDPSIQSPPVPKKQIFFVPESNEKLLSPVEEHQQQASKEELVETVNAMWK